MLQVHPHKRPTASELLNMPELKNNLGKTCAKLSADNKNHDLLETIIMPKNLKDLKNRLPKSQYTKVQRTTSLSALFSIRNYDIKSRAGSSFLRNQGSRDRNSSSNNQEPPRSNIITKKKALEPCYQPPIPRRYYSRDYSNRNSALKQAGKNYLLGKDRKIVHHLDLSNKISEESYYDEEKVSRQVPYKYQVGISPRRKPPLNAFNLNVPNPLIVNHHKESPRLAINNANKLGYDEFGLPPFRSKARNEAFDLNPRPQNKNKLVQNNNKLVQNNNHLPYEYAKKQKSPTK